MIVQQTPEFKAWLDDLRDRQARALINERIERIASGHYGEVKSFSSVGELRIDFGPGYRLYSCRRKAVVVILLWGGDKSSQDRDIKRAVAMAKEIEWP